MLGVVSSALTAMSVYIKRGIQARTKDLTTNLIVENLYLSASGEHQYVSGQAESNGTVTYSNTTNQVTSGKTTTNTVRETITRTADDYSVSTGWEDLLP